MLFVDLQPLHALMLQNRVVLEEAVRSEPRSTKKSAASGGARSLRQAQQSRRPRVQAARLGAANGSAASGPVDAVVGFPNITAFVRSDMALSAQEPNAGRNFGNTMELAVFGRSRVETELQHELGAGRVSLFATSGGPWAMKDISASGFRLHAPIKDAMDLTLNMLVAIHRHGDGCVGHGNRPAHAETLRHEDAEIGLQLIATHACERRAHGAAQGAGADYPVTGDNTAAAGRQFRGLFLSFKPAAGRAAGAVADRARGRIPRVAGSIRCGPGVPARTIRHGRLLEQHADWVWTGHRSGIPRLRRRRVRRT